MILSIKIPQKGREKNFKCSKEWQNDKNFQTLSPAIHLEGWARHFEHEYVVKLSKDLIESWKTNKWSQWSLKRSCPLAIESNTKFKSRVGLIETYSDPKWTQKFSET